MPIPVHLLSIIFQNRLNPSSTPSSSALLFLTWSVWEESPVGAEAGFCA